MEDLTVGSYVVVNLNKSYYPGKVIEPKGKRTKQANKIFVKIFGDAFPYGKYYDSDKVNRLFIGRIDEYKKTGSAKDFFGLLDKI